MIANMMFTLQKAYRRKYWNERVTFNVKLYFETCEKITGGAYDDSKKYEIMIM